MSHSTKGLAGIKVTNINLTMYNKLLLTMQPNHSLKPPVLVINNIFDDLFIKTDSISLRIVNISVIALKLLRLSFRLLFPLYSTITITCIMP